MWAALAPDGELSLLERRLLDAHLARCAACRRFADLVAHVTAELRAAAAQRPARRLAPPPAPLRRSTYARLRHVASIAAVAAMALGVASVTPDPVERERPTAPHRIAPAAVDAAEQHAIRILRREAFLATPGYPDRVARAFGNQPA